MLDIEKAITFEHLPGAYFADEAAVREHADVAAQYEQACIEFEQDGCEATLWEALTSIGFDAAEVQFQVDNPGKRLRCGYV